HAGAGLDWLVDVEDPMISMAQQLNNAHVLIVGCGATGVSAACFASVHGARVRVVDSRSTPPRADELRRRCPAAELRCGDLAATALQGIDQLLVSPGIDLREPLRVNARAQ